MEIYNIHCEFENPVWWNNQTESLEPLNSETKENFVWNFTDMYCLSDDVKLFENVLIQNTETEAEFLVKKSVSYGDFLIITFLMIFLIWGILKFLINFFIPKLMNFKK